MAEVLDVCFEDWLKTDLSKYFEVDEDIYVPYIVGILKESDESLDAAYDSINELFKNMDLKNVNISSTVWIDNVLSRWKRYKTRLKEEDDKTISHFNIAELMAVPNIATPSPSNISKKHDKEFKASILASQYVHNEHDDNKNVQTVKNMNIENVIRAEKESRERQKSDSAAKKQKDKADREAQKEKEIERKKKCQEKASKGERKR